MLSTFETVCQHLSPRQISQSRHKVQTSTESCTSPKLERVSADSKTQKEQTPKDGLSEPFQVSVMTASDPRVKLTLWLYG